MNLKNKILIIKSNISVNWSYRKRKEQLSSFSREKCVSLVPREYLQAWLSAL